MWESELMNYIFTNSDDDHEEREFPLDTNNIQEDANTMLAEVGFLLFTFFLYWTKIVQLAKQALLNQFLYYIYKISTTYIIGQD